MANQITGRVVSYTAKLGSEWHQLVVERDAEDDYEREHPERRVVPLDVAPYLAKRLKDGPPVGAVVCVEYRLTGREWNGKRYIGAAVQAVEVLDGVSACGGCGARPAAEANNADADGIPF